MSCSRSSWHRIILAENWERPASSQSCESLPQPSDNLQCSLRRCRAALRPQKTRLCQGPELGPLQMPEQEMKPSGGSLRAVCQSLHKGILLEERLWHYSSPAWLQLVRRAYKRMGKGLGRGENSVLGFSVQTLDLHFFTQFSLSALWCIQRICHQERSFRGALEGDGWVWVWVGGTIRCKELIPRFSSCQWHSFNKGTLPSSSSFWLIMEELWYFTRQEQWSNSP